ncbi:hypothetical protein K2173_009312 [Erythroxylum novogranatense]|uniref:Uncharacterized protein n=1 Tax=Erythroxylum novogranatense TaxID=1862640 RepID=A0AAV8U4V0_9ROSI|nr:hypothetical protein K2173_009312 [Erythroxylum novogranatense]
MDFLFKVMNEDTPECNPDEGVIQKCPFLRNINKPTSFSLSSLNCPIPERGVKGPIFEDGTNFDAAFKLFHGKDGIVPLSSKSSFHSDFLEPEPAPQFNPLLAKTATISLSVFGAGWPFSFGSFNDKRKKQKKSESNNKRDPSSQKGNNLKHEALGNEWLETGNCPIAKSYRAVSRVLPLVASTIQPPQGMKFRCPPAVVAARAALARTTLVKALRPQPLPSKMLAIGLLGMAVNVPLGVWREHTRKFSVSWFAAVHAAVPFIAMLRKSVAMPKTAMALTIGASILGQVIGSRAERCRLKAAVDKEKVAEHTETAAAVSVSGQNPSQGDGIIIGSHCGIRIERMTWDPLAIKASGPAASSTIVCY